MEKGRIKVWLPAIQAGSGADVYTRRLADSLERSGVTARITWFPKYCELLPILLKRTAPPEGTDIVIANSWNGFAFKGSGLPLIVIVHHCSFAPELQPYKSIAQQIYHRHFAAPRERRSLQGADAIIAVSAHVADGLRKQFGFGKVEVIHNWADDSRFRPVRENVLHDGPFRLLFVGKLTQLKGGDMLAPIMRKLGTDFELQATADEKNCKYMDCPENMHLIGHLSENELVRAYQRCDAVLVPSRSEGFGYAALEAMACGKPVVASDVAALPEIVKDGVTGILCKVGEVDEFVEACRGLAADPERCSGMGRTGLRHVTERFPESAAIAKYLNLIEQIVAFT